MYTKEEWNKALDTAQELGWDDVDIREQGGPIAVAVYEAYDSDKVGQDMCVLEAALVAAHSRYGLEWGIEEWESVWTHYVQVMDGFTEVAEDYFKTEFPGLLDMCGTHMDLEAIGRDYAKGRESEQYIMIPDDDGRVYIFNKLN